MKLTTQTIFLSSLVVLTAACGKVNDSYNDRYTNIRNKPVETATAEEAYLPVQEEVLVVSPTPTPEPEKQVFDNNLIELRTQGALNLTEGEASEFQVYASVKHLQMNYELVFSGLPEGALVERLEADGRPYYQVKWTPPHGFVAVDQDSRATRFEVELKLASELSESDQALFKTQTKNKSFEILVSRTRENPVIHKVYGLDGVIYEGSKIRFVIEIRDPGAQGSAPPVVKIKKDETSTKETVGVDGSEYISVDPQQSQPVSTAAGIWKFFFVYDTETKLAPRPDKFGSGNKKMALGEIPVRFKVEIQSPSRRSTTNSREFRLKYSVDKQAPKLNLAPTDNLTFEIGQKKTITFTVSSLLAGSKVVVKQKEAQALLNQTLPGGTKNNAIRCINESAAQVKCQLVWNVPCDESLVGSSHKIQVKATNQVGAFAVEAFFDRTLSVTKTKECTAANPSAGGKR